MSFNLSELSMKTKHYKFGDEENRIWAGDLRVCCEFIRYLPLGIMVFREITPRSCIRAVYYRTNSSGEVYLDGWLAFTTIKQLKAELKKKWIDYERGYF